MIYSLLPQCKNQNIADNYQANKQEEVIHSTNLDQETRSIAYCMDLMYILAQKEIIKSELSLI